MRREGIRHKSFFNALPSLLCGMYMITTFKNSNDVFYDFILPNKNLILNPIGKSYTNNIKFLSGNIFGDIGTAKSSIVTCITKLAIDKYGKHNVNAKYSPYGDLSRLIMKGLEKDLINILYCDDVTLRKIDRNVIRTYFTIRHLYKNAFNKNKGYILAMLGLHRFHSVSPELKNPQFLIMTSLPSNPFDYSLVKRFIGEYGIKTLTDLEKIKSKNPEYKKYSIFWLRTGEVGILESYLPEVNYLEEV